MVVARHQDRWNAHAWGLITAGTFYQEGERVFWDVHEPEKTVVIRLKDERATPGWS